MVCLALALVLSPTSFKIDPIYGPIRETITEESVDENSSVMWASSVTIAKAFAKRARRPILICVASRARSMDRTTISLNTDFIRERLTNRWVALSPFSGKSVQSILGVDPDQMAPGFYVYDSLCRFRGSIPIFCTVEELNYRLAEMELICLSTPSDTLAERAFYQSEKITLKELPNVEVESPWKASRVWRIVGDRRLMEFRRNDAQVAYSKSLELAQSGADRGVALMRLTSLMAVPERFVLDELLATMALEDLKSPLGRMLQSFLSLERMRFGSMITSGMTWATHDAFSLWV